MAGWSGSRSLVRLQSHCQSAGTAVIRRLDWAGGSTSQLTHVGLGRRPQLLVGVGGRRE